MQVEQEVKTAQTIQILKTSKPFVGYCFFGVCPQTVLCYIKLEGYKKLQESMQLTTLCFLIREGEILLAMKKRGFGVGKWNGVGGKLKDGESIEAAAVREMEEEIGVSADLNQLENIGSLKFFFQGKPDWDQHMHIYFVRNWQGEPRESEEMKPQWYRYGELPFDSMWCDDKHWLPTVLRGNKIEGEFHFNPDGTDFDRYKIQQI